MVVLDMGGAQRPDVCDDFPSTTGGRFSSGSWSHEIG